MKEMNLFIDFTGLLIALAGFVVIIIQLIKVDKSLKSSARGSIYDMASRIKELFIEKPYLRPYFFNGEVINESHKYYKDVIAVADYYCLYLEQITTQKKNISKSERESWLLYVHDLYHNSPIIQEYLESNREWYSSKFWKVVEG